MSTSASEKIFRSAPAPSDPPVWSAPREPFDLSHSPHELVRTFKPRFVAFGGEHIVYEIPEHPEYIVKIDYRKTRFFLEELQRKNLSLDTDTITDDLSKNVERYLDAESVRREQLVTYFGQEHVPHHRKFFAKIPVTPELLEVMTKRKHNALITEVWGVGMIQEYIPELKDEAPLTMCGYAEYQRPDSGAYKKMTDELIYGRAKEPFDVDAFVAALNKRQVTECVRALQDDAALRGVVADFVQRTVRFVSETHEHLDLGGPDNVIFYKKDGAWTFTLVDALYPSDNASSEKTIAEARDVIKKIVTTPTCELTGHEHSVLLNAVNFVRMINGLARMVGSNDFISLIPPEAADSHIDFLTCLQETV